VDDSDEPGRRSLVQTIGLAAGPAACAILLFFVRIPALDPLAQRALAVTAWIAIWWMTEPVSANATALIPFVAFPALGVMTAREAAGLYQNEVIFLFLGGSFLALAVENAGLHKRMAGALTRVFGSRPRGFLAGYVAAVTFTSFWMSNTATTLLYLPPALSLAAGVRAANPGRPEAARFAVALLITTAIASSIGGMATPIGTAPNMILVAASAKELQTQISFASWLAIGVPLAVALAACLWATLVFVSCRIPRDLALGMSLGAAGPWTAEEKRTGLVFAITVLSWITRQDIPVTDTFVIPGWSTLLQRAGVLPPGATDYVSDGGVAIAAALVLFIIPRARRKPPILDASAFEKMPWGALVLLGSSFVLAHAFGVPKSAGASGSSLSQWIAGGLAGLGALPLLAQLFAVALVVTFAGELASNTAMAALLIPIGFSLAPRLGVEPLVYGFTICLAASCSFMLPVATPPNTIVYGTRLVPLRALMATGLVLDLCGAVLIPLLVAAMR
jgi:solute carrier family 13 (sodium-dependent dicarboxylate transporter), member 2/3/5